MRTQAVVVQGKLTCSRFPPHAIAILSKESVFKPVILASMRQLESDRRVLKFSPDRRHQTWRRICRHPTQTGHNLLKF